MIRKVTPDGTISTVAGTGNFGFSGDGGPAINAALNHPDGVAVDASGNLYVADNFNARIRKVTSDGTINTIAGTGFVAFTGDGGPAASATLSLITGVAVDTFGNVFIADSVNDRIRKINPAGIISSFVGNGRFRFVGDGGPATSAALNYPSSVAADTSGNIFFTDPFNARIRKVTPAGIISTVAGNGAGGFSGDGGPATQAGLFFPFGVAVDSSGNLFIADTDNVRIRKVTPQGIISTVAGNGSLRIFGRWRISHQRVVQSADIARGGRGGKSIHRRQQKQSHSKSDAGWHYQHRGRQGHRGLFRGWRPGSQRRVEFADFRGGSSIGRALHCRQRERSSPKSVAGRGYQHRSRERRRRLFKRWRTCGRSCLEV